MIQYKVNSVKISNGYLCLNINDIDLQYKISEISKTLSNAKEEDLNNFEVTPSGYGIHWHLLDEDISILGLLNQTPK